MRHYDQILGICEFIAAIQNIIHDDRVDVVYDDHARDLKVLVGQITTSVTDDNMVTQLSPDLRPVESLVKVSIGPESLVSGDAIELEVFEAIPVVGI
jgi:hypothetical protein